MPIARLAVELRGGGSSPGGGDEDEVRVGLRRTLGLDIDLSGFYRLARRDPRLTAMAARFSGMRPPSFPSVFEALVNAIACQRLSLTVRIHLLNLAARYGDSVSPAADAPRAFPGSERLVRADPEDLRALGFSRSKARAIVALAVQVEAGELDLEALRRAGDVEARAVLLDIGGVGRWSAEYTMLRGLGRLHVLPGDDVGARNNLRRRFGLDASAGYDELSQLARSWSPYGGLVYFHLLLDSLADAGHVIPTTSAHTVTSSDSESSYS
jgi:DNA-3-methyladenine glycosylase II